MTKQSVQLEENSNVEVGGHDSDTEAYVEAEPGKTARSDRKRGPARAIGDSAVKVRTIVTSLLAVIVVAVIALMGWQVQSRSNEIDQMKSSAADNAHAEQVALDYSVAAASMDFHDVASWRARLTKDTSPELSNKLTQAASSMEQIITPLQWVSTSTPIASKVRSVDNGVYSVDCFVNVLTKNTQAPDGIQSTATYRLSIDSEHDWAITDVGGIGAALPGK